MDVEASGLRLYIGKYRVERLGFAERVPLAEIDTQRPQLLGDRRCLDKLGDCVNILALCELHDRLNSRDRALAREQVEHKAAVDLDARDRQAPLDC